MAANLASDCNVYLSNEERENYVWRIDRPIIHQAIQVYNGILNEESQRVHQPDGFIGIQLKEHQLASIYAMNQLEQRKDRCANGINFGVLADSVGSGKSYSLLGFLLQNPLVSQTWENFTNMKHHPSMDGSLLEAQIIFPANLLVVSHSIFNQWITYLDHTTIKYLKISRQTDFPVSPQALYEQIQKNSVQIVLIKANHWNKMAEFIQGPIDNPHQRARNPLLMEAVNKLPTHPMVYRDEIKKIFKKIYEKTKSWHIDTMITNRLSQLNHEQEGILKQVNELETLISQIRTAPEKYHLQNILNQIEIFGDKHVTEMVSLSASKWAWNRIIVDEVDTVKISAAAHMNACFYWFLTNNIENLMFPRGILHEKGIFRDASGLENARVLPMNASGFHTLGFFRTIWENNIFQYYHDQLQHVFLRNQASFVQSSFLYELPAPIYLRYWIQAPRELLAVQGIVSQDVIERLQAGDWTGAVHALGGRIDISSTQEDFLNKIKYEMETNLTSVLNLQEKQQLKINKIEQKLQYWQERIQTVTTELTGISEEQFPEQYGLLRDDFNLYTQHHTNYIAKQQLCIQQMDEIKNTITHQQSRIQLLQERVLQQMSDSHCSICLDLYRFPLASVPCCHHMFCLSCLTQWLQTKNQCVMCRKPLQIKNCQLYDQRFQPIQQEQKPIHMNHFSLPIPTQEKQLIQYDFTGNKTDVMKQLIQTIQTDPNYKILIYSEHDASFTNHIIPWLTEHNYLFEQLSGNSGSIESRIRKFRDGTIRILLLNARHFGSGLNLEMTTDLILYHRMTEPLERQILGRGQRFGRSNPLRVHSLLYREIESTSSILKH